MFQIKPIPYKAQKLTLGLSSQIEVASDFSLSADKNFEAKYGRAKNYKYKNVEIHEGNNYNLQQHRKLKQRNFRKLSNLTIVLNSNIWSNRSKVFISLVKSLKGLAYLKNFSVTIDFCLDIRAINFLLNQMRALQNIKRFKIDLSKFYRVPLHFIKALSNLIRSFVQLKAVEVALRKTPERSFNDDLVHMFQTFTKMKYLEHLALWYSESIQFKKDNQSNIPNKLVSEIGKLLVSSFSLHIKSNSLFEELSKQLVTSISSNQNLKALELDLQDVENVLNVGLTCNLLDKLNTHCCIENINLNNQTRNASEDERNQLCTSTLKFLSCHPSLSHFKMRQVAPSYFKGMKLASAITSLKRLTSLNLIITSSNDLILLQELGKLVGLKELSIVLEFELDTQISGFLESLGSLSRLKSFKLESKKKIPGMFFQREDFKLLMNSLLKMKNLKQLSIWLPTQESSNPNVSNAEIQMMTDFIKNNVSLEECLMTVRWGYVSNADLIPLFEVFFQTLKVSSSFEFWLGLRNSTKINFVKILQDLQRKYQKVLTERHKKGPRYNLTIKTD